MSIDSLENFVERALSFDFYTEMSDDHGVWQRGKAARDAMDAYAAANPVAGKLWERICANQLEMFMAGQLITRVEAVTLNKHATKDAPTKAAFHELCDFMPYLVQTGRKTMMARSVREAIAKLIDAPPQYPVNEERDRMVNEFISTYRSRFR